MDETETKQVNPQLGRSAAIVHALALGAVVCLVIIANLLRMVPTQETELRAFASLSEIVFAVFWFWSVVLAIRSMFRNEKSVWTEAVIFACIVELLLAICSVAF